MILNRKDISNLSISPKRSTMINNNDGEKKINEEKLLEEYDETDESEDSTNNTEEIIEKLKKAVEEIFELIIEWEIPILNKLPPNILMKPLRIPPAANA